MPAYFVKTNEVDIIIKPGAEITEEDIRIQNHIANVEPEDGNTLPEALPSVSEPSHENAPSDAFFYGEEQRSLRTSIRPPQNEYAIGPGWTKPKKKSFTVMLYPDEHERLMRLIKENGYKKVEYILACIDSAKKTSMEANYKRLTEEHERRRKADAEEAKKAREEEQRTSHDDDAK